MKATKEPICANASDFHTAPDEQVQSSIKFRQGRDYI